VPIAAHRTRRRAERRTLLVGLPLAGVSALWLAPELLGLAARSPFAQVVAFRPVLAAGQLALAASVGLVRRRWWPATLAVGGAAVVALGTVISRTSTGPAPPPGPELSILSFNVWHGRADVAALAAVVRDQRPDLVVLPEAGQRFRERLEPELDGLGYSSWVTIGPGEREAAGIVVLAAAALGELTATPVELGTRLRWIRLSGGGLGEVGVVAVHTSAPVRHWMPRWASDLELLRTWLGEGRGPHVVVGDLNASLDHAPLRAATAGAVNVAAARGQGLASTWPTAWPRWLGVQIDHVFVSGGVHPAEARVLDLPGSDHRALLARVVLPSR
jgi:endonuclease/exonuclease/phosphatase (EEP) superfamily protein YafD